MKSWKIIQELKIAGENDIEQLVELLREELSTDGIVTYVDVWRFSEN